MGAFIEFIFANMFFVVLVIAGLISALSKNKEAQQKGSQQSSQRSVPRNRTQGPSQSRSQTASRTTVKKPERKDPIQSTDRDQIGGGISASIEAEQQAQMENLETKFGVSVKDLNSGDYSDHKFASTDKIKALDILSDEQEKLKDDLRSNLRKKGFINGIIMAEVLGKPRALKQYRSPILDRYEK